MTGRGRLDDEKTRQLLESIAFQQLAESAQSGLAHASRLARLSPGGWQADVIRKSTNVITATNAHELSRAMESSATVIFLPQGAAVTAEIIEKICGQSALAKVIVWETD